MANFTIRGYKVIHGHHRIDSAYTPPPPPPPTGWQLLPIGAGGFITGIDIAADGTKVCRTDTYGAYIWSTALSRWAQLVTVDSMPGGTDGSLDYEHGVYEIRICPSNTQRFYMVFLGRVYISNNQGATWTRTAFSQVTFNDPGSTFANDISVTTYPKLHGPRIAIDPQNADHLLVGTGSSGLFRSVDAGATWSGIASVPVGSDKRGVIVCFDPSSSVVSGRKQGVFAASQGNGVYASTNGGGTFAITAGTPTTHNHMVCASDGKLFLTPDDGSVNMQRYSGGVWTSTSIGTANGRNVHCLAIDPTNVARIVAVCSSGEVSVSLDSGATWAGLPASANTNLRSSATIGWMAATNEAFMGASEACFDPTQTNRLYFGGGIGVWYLTPNNTSTVVATAVADSVGIEQLVANQVVFPPGGTPVVSAWDRPLFKSPSFTTYPSGHGPGYVEPIQMGWDVTFAISDPTFLAAIVNWATDKSCYSTDSGATWTKFTNFPDTIGTGKIGGAIAASTTNNIVFVESNNGQVFYTLNRGASAWTAPSFAGVPSSGENGFGFAYYTSFKTLCADRVTSLKYYIFNYLTGIWMSSDGGTTWTLVHSGAPASGATNSKMKTVPGNAGHLFFSGGRQGSQGDVNPTASSLMRSSNAGVTWTAVGNLQEVYDFSFGAIAPGGTYPVVFAAGWNSGVWGIWQSDDNCVTWTNLGGYPLGSFDWLTCMAADPDTYGRVVVGYRGMGWAYYGI